MRILVAVASRHGATAEMAEWIGASLREVLAGSVHPLQVDVCPAADVASVSGYDAAVIGSAVYMGRWLADARRLVERNADQLASIPVWIFSSGPLGDPPAPEESPGTTATVPARLAPRGRQVFTGRLEPRALGRMERAMARTVKAPAGDYRDRATVRAWGAGIGAALLEHAASRT